MWFDEYFMRWQNKQKTTDMFPFNYMLYCMWESHPTREERRREREKETSFSFSSLLITRLVLYFEESLPTLHAIPGFKKRLIAMACHDGSVFLSIEIQKAETCQLLIFLDHGNLFLVKLKGFPSIDLFQNHMHGPRVKPMESLWKSTGRWTNWKDVWSIGNRRIGFLFADDQSRLSNSDGMIETKMRNIS